VKDLFDEKYYTVVCHSERSEESSQKELYYLDLPALHRDQLISA
jgi:hypothetical protein